MAWADYVDHVLEYEFAEDAHLQCEHCGQHIADPGADTLDVDVVDGFSDRSEWSATVKWHCCFCGEANETKYGDVNDYHYSYEDAKASGRFGY